MTVELKTLKKGEFFKRKADAKTVFIKGDAGTMSPFFVTCRVSDNIMRFIYLKGSTPVFTDFEF